jgi:hypothetical protein
VYWQRDLVKSVLIAMGCGFFSLAIQKIIGIHRPVGTGTTFWVALLCCWKIVSKKAFRP